MNHECEVTSVWTSHQTKAFADVMRVHGSPRRLSLDDNLNFATLPRARFLALCRAANDVIMLKTMWVSGYREPASNNRLSGEKHS